MDPFPWIERRVSRWLGLDRDPRRRSWLRRLFAVWLAFHVCAVVLVALPTPTPLSAALLGRPSVKEEITRWYERLRPLGLARDRAAFEAFVVRVSRDWSQARGVALAPLAAYLDLIRVRQAWYMFTAPDRAPERFRVQAGPTAPKRGGTRPPRDLRLVFELGQPIARPDLAPPAFLHHYRVRRALLMAAWGQNDGHLSHLCALFERSLAARDSEIRAIRCSLVRRAVEHPDRVGTRENGKTVWSSLRRVAP